MTKNQNSHSEAKVSTFLYVCDLPTVASAIVRVLVRDYLTSRRAIWRITRTYGTNKAMAFAMHGVSFPGILAEGGRIGENTNTKESASVRLLVG